MRWFVCTALNCLLAISAMAASTASPPTIAGRAVIDVLRDFNQHAFHIVYSTDLVRPSLHFPAEPPTATQPLDRLKTALQSVGLSLRPFSNARWLVVRHTTEEPAQSEKSAPPREVAKPAPRMEEIVVVSSRHVLKKHQAMFTHTLTTEEISALPELGDDAIRSVLYLPGVASIGVSARPHVRGGARDEILVVYNDIELIEPYHLKDYESLFSTLNPSLIQRVEIYTGGFPARYGDRMSGVMDIQPTQDFPEFGVELSLSALTTTAAAYGTHEDKEWALSVRRGNLDLLTKWINPDAGVPSYIDYSSHLNFDIANGRMEVGFLAFSDNVELRDLENDSGELARSDHHNAYAWAKYATALTVDLRATTTLSYARLRHDRGGFSNDDAADESTGEVNDRRQFNLVTLSHRLNWGNRFEFGASLSYQHAKYRYHANASLGELAVLLGRSQQIDIDTTLSLSGLSGSAYASAHFQPKPSWKVEIGARFDFQNYGAQSASQFSPRVSIARTLGRSAFHLSTGRYYQSEGINELHVQDGANAFGRAQYADHLIAGWTHRFAHPAWQLRIEGFLKRIENPKVRHDNLFNPLALLPEIKPDRVTIAPSAARARGVEAMLQYNPSPDLNFWLAYTNSRAVDRVAGQTRRRAWNQSHTLQMAVAWNNGPYSVSAGAVWHSGWQITDLPTDLERIQPLKIQSNSQELPNFFSLNLRARRAWEWPNHTLALYVELTNATNRENVGGYQHEIEEVDSGYTLASDRRTLLPRVPSIGVEWKFR